MTREEYLSLDADARMSARLDAMAVIAGTPGFKIERAPKRKRPRASSTKMPMNKLRDGSYVKASSGVSKAGNTRYVAKKARQAGGRKSA